MNFQSLFGKALRGLAAAALLGCPFTASADEGRLISPGKGIGTFQIGEPLNAVTAKHGEPTLGDMALGRGQAFWQDPPAVAVPNESSRAGVRIFVTRFGDRKEYVTDEVSTTSKLDQTEQKVGPGSTLAAIKKAYSGLKAVPGDAETKIVLYDAPHEGVAFEIDSKSICLSVIVHRPDTTVVEIPELMPSKKP